MGPRRGLLFIFAAALLWSTGGMAIKMVDEPPLKIAFYRCAIAAIPLLLYFRPRLRPASPALIVALVAYATTLTTFVLATKWTTAANAIFLQYSGVIWVLLLSPLVLGEPLRRKDAVAITVALGGMALFFVGELEARGMWGNMVALVSSIFFATLLLALRKEREGGARAAITYGNVLGAGVLLPFVVGDLSVSGPSIAVLSFLGVAQIALAYALFVEGIKSVTATQAALTGMIEPIANPLWVFLFLGERPSRFALIGGLIVIAAIAWRTLTVEERSDEGSPV